MPRKKTAGGKKGKKVKQTAPAVASSKPARARNLDHLRNKRMHGLEFGLTQRNNLLIDCYAADRVPREVILACFEDAGIYPPEASATLVSKQQSTRTSRRIAKVDASKDLQRISNDPNLSTDQKIIQCSQVVENVMELAKYEQTSAEDLCPRKRKKKKKRKKSEPTTQESDSEDSTSLSRRPAYSAVVGNFSPGALHAVRDSFVREREEWSKVRLFVCDVKGCSFGLRGAPSRFSAEGYLRSHMKLKHGLTLPPMDAALVKDLKRRQLSAAAAESESQGSASTVAAADQQDDHDGKNFGGNAFFGVEHECMRPNPTCDNGDICGHRCSDLFSMHQHYWIYHLEDFFDGMLLKNCDTGDLLDLMDDAPIENWREWCHIMQRLLGLDLRLFNTDGMVVYWNLLQQDADNNDGQPDHDRVQSALTALGAFDLAVEDGAFDLAGVVNHPAEQSGVSTPSKKKKKLRTCSRCRQIGHDKRTCKSKSLSPISSLPISPIQSVVYSFRSSPQPGQQSSGTVSPNLAAVSAPLVITPPQQKTCSVQ